MALSIDLTVRGVLLAAHWRTAEELDYISTENKRNTLIVELAKTCTNQSVPYFQGFDDDHLVGKASIWLLLKALDIPAGPNTPQNTDGSQRNTLITLLNARTDTPIATLQSKSDPELVTQGIDWFNKSRTVTGILEFTWVLDTAKVVSTTPDVIYEQTYQNTSDLAQDDEFTFEKTIESSSEFSHDHSFEFKLGVSTEFEAGIPFVAKNTTTVEVTTGTKNTWKFGESNSTSQKYSHTTKVKVPPHTTIKRSATVTRGTLNVPYSAKIRTGAGTERSLQGIWSGVSTWNLVSKQESVNGTRNALHAEPADSLPDAMPTGVK